MAMGTGVTCPIFRYRPAIVAQVWASLSSLAPGRVFLGLGSGEKLNEGAAGGGWGPYEERASRLVEAVEIIRAFWTGNPVRIHGRFWSVEGRLYDPPPSPIPIYIAAGGPKAARLAGLHGDGMITGASGLKTDSMLKEAWEAGLREAGKGNSKGVIMVEHWAFVGDPEEAREQANKWRFIPKAWERGYFDNISPAEIQSRAEQEISLDDVLKDWTVSPEPGPHIEAIRKLSGLGATHVVVHVATPRQSRAIDFFGKQVVPALKGA